LQKDYLYKLLVGFKNNSSISYGFQDLMGLNGPNRKITPMPKIKWVKPETSDQPDRDDLI
jgi:hypothetical protein